ncbi:RDD family protein [Marinitenerispora sediminis]|uniref:RDD family protein n=1 Tax=Marinitenerispora sediminis TaxID=1931232 RepID=A0A368TBT9_9ACTN|nr:RDD family protein [Marinitenerispora sediminis]RCV54405.1 RDD family protein [Marinitenerispora sediminis]RCV61134.1 RDD family protein [Marinitenerispora sediminis]RCV62410.1 RDD family protein [Marinitenerispora sediminis]
MSTPPWPHQPPYGPPQHSPPAWQQAGHPVPAPGPRFAGFGRRLAARAIDYVLVAFLAFLFFVVVIIFLSMANPEAAERNFTDGFYDLWAFLFLFGWGGVLFFYDWLFHVGTGRTPGKRLVSIKVVRRADGGRLTQGQAIGRAALFGLPQSLTCLGHLFALACMMWLAFDPDRGQALHDRASGTLVIRG